MANYCFTMYAIEGDKEILEKVADAINRGEGWTKKSIENLGLTMDTERYEYAYRAEWVKEARVEVRDGVSVLFFSQAYPWEHVDIINEVLEQLGEPNAKIYMLMHYWEVGEHYTNDHEGKYFPHRFITYTEEENGDAYFLSKEEALAHIRQQYKLSDEYDTFEKIEQYCEDNDQCVSLNEIVEIER
ncbi:MAG: hypothetical protein Q4D33_12590 [Prevotellaceae bacterium]|nr:hypothetical protein [Prevotellaceae bacterium]